MLKRLKAAILALLGEPARPQEEELSLAKLKSIASMASCSPVSVDGPASGEDPSFDHHTWNRLGTLYHYYRELGDMVDAKSMVERMRRMAIGHIEDKERAEHRDEIASAANPGQPGQGNQGRL